MSLHHHRGLRSRSSRSADEENNEDDIPTPASECSSMDISSAAGRSSEHMADAHSRASSSGNAAAHQRHRLDQHQKPGDHHQDGSHRRVEHPPSGPNVDRRDEFRRISRCASVATSVISLDAAAAESGSESGAQRDVEAAVEKIQEETLRELDEESAEAKDEGRRLESEARRTSGVSTAEGEEKKEKDEAEPQDGAPQERAALPPVPQPPVRSRSLTIRLSAEEERLFDVLISAAEAYERGDIRIDESKFQNASNAHQSIEAGRGCSPVPEEGEEGTKGAVETAAGNGKKKQIEIRVAGGWVRDKILDMHSHDVDVSLDCMSGVQFATIVKEHLLQLEREGKIPHPVKHHKIGVICANPSQSKHLETATMKIFNIEVDFVNLRAEEVYESDSRIPTQGTKQFGTPLEDALRRDFTINSLFYNIRTRQVEDWAERGIDDLLDRRLIVTPLDPHTTFRDDPLRVLRAIRFAVRYNMDLADDIVAAATSTEVHSALHRKVSRERVGKELEGMLSGKGARPDRALDLINGLRLAGSVFTFPPGADSTVSGRVLGLPYGGSPDDLAKVRAKGWEEATELIRTLPRALESHRDELLHEETLDCEEDAGTGSSVHHHPPMVGAGVGSHAGHDADIVGGETVPPPTPLSARKRLQSFSMCASVDVRILHLAVFLLPFRDLSFPDKKGRIQLVPCNMIRDGVKFKNRDITAMGRLLENVDRMRDLMRGLKEQQRQAAEQREHGSHHEGHEFPVASVPHRLCRLETGLFLREIKELWVTCLILATVIEMREAESGVRTPGAGSGTDKSGISFHGAEEVMRISRELYRSIRTQGLDGVWKARPLLNGREIIAALDVPKGPLVSLYVEEQIKWMLLNPHGKRDECERHLRMVKRKKEMEEEHHHGEVQDEQNEVFVGVSDGGHSSPVISGRTEAMERHFSKRMHVERVDSLPDI